MRVIITGGTGQVGKALLSSVPSGIDAMGLSRSVIDLTELETINATFHQLQPDLVINTAAYTAVDQAEGEEALAQQINGEAVEALAAASANCGARLLQVSTDFVFDGTNSRPYLPEDFLSPQSAYGRSKLAGEKAALISPENLVVRTAWVYAAGGQNFVETMLKLMRERGGLRVVSDQIGTPTHAASLAPAMWQLISKNAQGIVHFTDAGVASWYDFAVAIQEEALSVGLLSQEIPILPVTTDEYPTAAKRPHYSVLEKSETWKLLGQPARHWRAELRDMLKSLKDRDV